ncbi:MAG: hypothetical protein J0L97_02580 [Alphaproteobacteria bacterium]|nr:hypothetical protein [Alphaproteobacteria bacterium]
MAQDNAATGGMLVILGIVLAIGIAILLYKGNILGGERSSGPSVNVEVSRPEAPATPAQ